MSAVVKTPDVCGIFVNYIRAMLCELSLGSKEGVRSYLDSMGEFVELLPLPKESEDDSCVSVANMENMWGYFPLEGVEEQIRKLVR